MNRSTILSCAVTAVVTAFLTAASTYYATKPPDETPSLTAVPLADHDLVNADVEILDGDRPVRTVFAKSEKRPWLFSCQEFGDDSKSPKKRLVPFGEIAARDPSLRGLIHMRMNDMAERENAGAPWELFGDDPNKTPPASRPPGTKRLTLWAVHHSGREHGGVRMIYRTEAEAKAAAERIAKHIDGTGTGRSYGYSPVEMDF